MTAGTYRHTPDQRSKPLPKYAVRCREAFGTWEVLRTFNDFDAAQDYFDSLFDAPGMSGERVRLTNWPGTRIYADMTC